MEIQPHDFLEVYVKPAIRDWHDQPNALHRAAAALASIDTLAEVVFSRLRERGTYGHGYRASVFRKELRARHPILGLVWDAHDSHKHGKLTYHLPRALTQGQRPEVTSIGWDEGLWDEMPWDGVTVICLVQDDGIKRPLGSVLSNALDAWEDEFTRFGF